MKVWILSKLFFDPPSPLKFGSKNRYQSVETVPRMFFNTTKMEVWIWGLTPPTPLDKFHTFIFFLMTTSLYWFYWFYRFYWFYWSIGFNGSIGSIGPIGLLVLERKKKK